MKTIYSFIALLLLMIGLAGCFEDKSTLNHTLINPIVIDLGDFGQSDYQTPSYSLFSLDTLVITPIVYREGKVDTNLTFTWTLSGNSIEPVVLGQNMTLKACITAPAESNSYHLLFTAKDKTTGISAEQPFSITVNSSFGKGLLVADTKDGQKGDVSLIMAYHFTYGLKKEQTSMGYDLFSTINGRKVEYPIISMQSSTYQAMRNITLVTANSLDRIDPFNFNYIDGNGSMFIIDPGTYNGQAIGWIGSMGMEMLSMNGKLYPRAMSQSNKYYSYHLLTKNMSSYRASYFCNPPYSPGLVFDEENGRLLQIDGNSPLAIFNSDQLASDAPFDHNKLQDFTCKALFIGKDVHAILQHKTSGKIYSYVTQLDESYPYVNSGKPLSILDLSSCPDIQNAVAFTAVTTQSVFYYATATKIYSVYYRGSDITVTEEYLALDNEEISHMIAWTDSEGKINYTNPNPSADEKVLEVSCRNRMLAIATYNKQKSEGFIRAIAIATVGTGTLEKDYKLHGEYGGFSKITSIVPQTK